MTFLPQGGLLIWGFAMLHCTVHWILVLLMNACSLVEHTHSVHRDAHSLSSGGYELHSHIHTHSISIPCSISKYDTAFHYFQPSHTPLCVEDSYSRTHIVNNSNHKTNMPRFVCFSFYLFKTYHHHMYSILSPACPEHCSFVRPCR